MTQYINPVRRGFRHRMLDDIMQNQNEDYAAEINFLIDVIADNDTFVIKA